MTEHIEHIEHDNGIHEIIFLDASRAAVDVYINLIESLSLATIEDGSANKLRLIINMAQIHDLPSFTYITTQSRKMIDSHLSDRSKIHIRGAFLAKHDEMLVLSLAENFIKLMPIDMKVKALEADSRDEAINWLLSDE